MAKLIDVFNKERECEYKGNIYSVRDNGSIMRHPNGNKKRKLDGIWTFGTLDIYKNYRMFSSEPVHRIVATAFLGNPPSKEYVVDHIDTNRQNNRPNNLRWVTRLDNILLNDTTREKMECICGRSIEEIMKDISILRNYKLPPQFEWMRTVTEEETNNSVSLWKEWKEKRKELSDNEDIILNKNKQISGYRNVYPLEPIEIRPSLDEYYISLERNKVFAFISSYKNNYKFLILDYCYSNDKTKLIVSTTCDMGVKSLFLTIITIKDDVYSYDTNSFFTNEGLEKAMIIAKGDQWTGETTFDDLC